jgi:hypothetical protein
MMVPALSSACCSITLTLHSAASTAPFMLRCASASACFHQDQCHRGRG